MNVISHIDHIGDSRDTSFNCAPWLGHGIQWPHNEKNYLPQNVWTTNFPSTTQMSDHDYSFSAAKLKQFELALSARSSNSEAKDEFYKNEYNDLIEYVDQGYGDPGNTGHEREQIRNISEVADEDLKNIIIEGGVSTLDRIHHENSIGASYWDGSTSSHCTDELALWMESSDRQLSPDTASQLFISKSLLKESLQSPDFQSMVDEHLRGFGQKRPEHWEPQVEDENRKRRLCRHFLKGHCKRGRACDFLHDPSIFCPDFQKVFLGGLPAHITETTLQEKLAQQGYSVINKPKVLRGFTPQVCLGSVEEAQKLINKGRIFIDGSQVDVRPYEAFAKDDMDKRLPDDTKRSVFIGGLSNGTTGQMIIDAFEKLDVKVVNHPLIKTGFTPKVTLGGVEQAQKLIKMKRVRIHHSLVDIRPYVNFRDSPSQRKKKY
jgi:hypothetical protein